MAEFARVNPARRTARKLIVTGPMVGGVLGGGTERQPSLDLADPAAGTHHAWPDPAAAITMILVAALGSRYQRALRAGLAGCIGITTLDITMITGVLLAAPVMTWATIGATAASAARIAFTTQAAAPMLTR